MVEVFITDIKRKCQAMEIVTSMKKAYPKLKVNFDMDETGLPFPEGHTVLRVEGEDIYTEQIILMVKKLQLNCEIMEE
ncbi:hypothetical protein [uncultured Maribacter sp.]|uniref:hypothetical protein n=1 Tax=uncultured Maribacter sp. TaxID=431308 RepID=UPI00260360C2|nr:hypothetical protein [uncultured Maribacter sp.]